MTDLLQLDFFTNALMMSLFLSILFGVLSFFIVLRRMAFLGAGIAHTAFGGIALGLLLGVQPFVTSLVFCVIAAIMIGQMARSGRLSYDTGIGIFFSFSMALGAVFIALRKAYTFDVSGYLFGNILGVTRTDLVLVLVALLLVTAFIWFFFQKLLFMTFEESVASVSGFRPHRLEILLLVSLALVIVVSIKMVGIILVSALVVLPGSFGLLFWNRYRGIIVISILFTFFVMEGGLFLSYLLDLPAGATMVVLGTMLYLVSFIVRRRTA